MPMIIRPASLDDVSNIVPYVKMASGGLSDFLLANLIPNMSVDDVVEMALTDENTNYYFQNFLVAECEGQIIGATHYYPAEQHSIADLMQSFIAKEKLDIIAPYLNTAVPNSMYVNTMAVAESYRTSLCSLLMGKKVEQIARQQKRKCLSAHVWRENKLVYEGLIIAGFQEVEEFIIEPQPELIYHGPMVLLKGLDFA